MGGFNYAYDPDHEEMTDEEYKKAQERWQKWSEERNKIDEEGNIF